MRLSGTEVAGSSLVQESMDLAETVLSPHLFNHVMRSWLFAAVLAPGAAVVPGPELLAVAVLLRDPGLPEDHFGPEPFEVDGANAARSSLTGAA